MHLIERLEKRAREFDRQIWDPVRGYDQQAADDRELLLCAASLLKRYVWQNSAINRFYT